MRSKAEVTAAVLAAIEAQRQRIIEIGEYVWQNPEPGYREFKTSALAKEVLQELGLPLRDKLSITGMRADLDSGRPEPTLAILGEMDSLILPSHPESDLETGAAHACGHHSHITAMLGTAMALVQAGFKEDMAGKIAFVPVPAEECLEIAKRIEMMNRGEIKAIGGKASMIREGVFDDVNLAIMNHLSIADGYSCSLHNGFVVKNLLFQGKSCHAGSPARGINALNIATLAQNALAMLRETFTDPSIRMHGIITQGGASVNIVPDKIVMEYLLRADDMEKIKNLSTVFDRAVQGAAHALGGKAEIHSIPGYAVMKDHRELWQVFEDAVRYLYPEAQFRSDGKSTGSTDMGDLSMIMPSIHATVPGAAGTSHGIDYHVKDKEAAYLDNTRILALCAIELLYGDAERGRTVAAQRQGLISIPEYIEMMDSLTQETTNNIC